MRDAQQPRESATLKAATDQRLAEVAAGRARAGTMLSVLGSRARPI